MFYFSNVVYLKGSYLSRASFYLLFVHCHAFLRKIVERRRVAFSKVSIQCLLSHYLLPFKIKEYSLPCFFTHSFSQGDRFMTLHRSFIRKRMQQTLAENLKSALRFHLCANIKITKPITKRSIYLFHNHFTASEVIKPLRRKGGY